MGKAKIIIPVVIIAIGVIWLATNMRGVNDLEYSINSLDELCVQEEEIFSGVIAQGYYDESRRWAETQGSLLQLSNLQDKYAHKIREKYDMNPVLYSDVHGRLQGSQLNCE